MKIEVGEYINFFYERGQEAPVIGMGDRAFFREDALEGLALLERLRVPVPSGGVYKLSDGKVDIAYAWWSTKLDDYDEYEDFLEESYKETLRYINMFKDSPECRYLFEFNLPFSFHGPEDNVEFESWLSRFES